MYGVAVYNGGMKTLDTIAGKTYVVSSPNGGTVTSADGLVKETVEAGKQKVVFGTGAPLQLDDDAGQIVATFKLAPVKLRLLGLLGGGVSAPSSALPAGYIAAEFLESSGQGERIKTAIKLAGDSHVICEYMLIQAHGVNSVFGYSRNPYFYYSANYGGYGGSPLYRYGAQSAYIEKVNGVSMAKELNRKRLIEVKAGILTVDGFTPIYYGTPPDHEENFVTGWNCYVFGADGNMSNQKMRVYKFFAHSEAQGSVELFPCLDAQGVPCMFDKVTGNPLYNDYNGAFIVGLNLMQARKLSKLPDTGGTLTISLPTGYESDAGVANALETARANGWTLTIQTYEAETAAATFGMRRVWVRKTQDEHGAYVDADGTRWQVDWCVAMYTPDGSEPDAHGYEMYRSVDAAVAYWELEPYVDPNEEELLIEGE